MLREPKDRRAGSIAYLLAIGVRVPDHLPTIDEYVSRGPEETVNRLFCLNAVAAAAYGFASERALAWLEQEHLIPALERPETDFLLRSVGIPTQFQWQVEGMYSLAGALSIYDKIDVLGRCPDDFVHKLPNLKTSASGQSLRQCLSLKSSDEILDALDLAYCSHWAVREARLRGGEVPAIALDDYSLSERRRGLEWLVSEASWYEVSLDT